MPVEMKTTFVDAKNMHLNAGQMQRKFEKLPVEVKAGTMKGLRAAVLILEREVIINISNKLLKRRSGKFAQSIRTFVREQKGEGGVGTPLVYAPTHEFGATIVPKNVKWLTIPIGELRGKANVPRITEFENLKFIFGKKGGIAYYGKYTPAEGGGRGTVERPMFALVKKVKIPARKPFKKAQTAKEDAITKAFDTHTAAQLKKEGYN